MVAYLTATSLLVPAKQYAERNVETFDPLVEKDIRPPSKHAKGTGLREGELILTKDEADQGWFLSEVLRILPDVVEVRYFTTPTPPLETYEHRSTPERMGRLREACFRRTWHVRFGKHVG